MFGNDSSVSLGATGSHHTQIAGDGNIIDRSTVTYNFHPPHHITKSKIFELLKVLRDTLVEEGPEYLLADPGETDQKLKHNRAGKYIRRFHRSSPTLAAFNGVMKDFPDSEAIVSAIQDLYEDVADINESGELAVGDGERHLDEVRSQLIDRVINSAGYNPDDYHLEDIEQFVGLLMLYGVWKCKLLVNPLDEESSRASA